MGQERGPAGKKNPAGVHGGVEVGRGDLIPDLADRKRECTNSCRSMEALSIYRHNDRVSKAVHDAVSARGEKTLLDGYRREFEGPA